MSTTTVSRQIHASPSRVYRALLDPAMVQQWMVPDGMTSDVHAFDAQRGGSFRISLTYRAPDRTGKTSGRTDTFHGTFVRLVPDREVVQAVEFETDDPAMQGVMTISYRLRPSAGGTMVEGVHEHLPPGVSPGDNELGWAMSLAKLAALVEDGHDPTSD
jgi:uncharacterized protein YndB with AHSA1/START domain